MKKPPKHARVGRKVTPRKTGSTASVAVAESPPLGKSSPLTLVGAVPPLESEPEEPKRKKPRRLPPYCGLDLLKPITFNPYQEAMLAARRLRRCPKCQTMSPVDAVQHFRCVCGFETDSQVEAAKVFKQLAMFAGRRAGKSRIGAQCALEEITVPNGLGWICGPTFKVLHDATVPTFSRLLDPALVADWSETHMELTLTNGHVVQCRSLDDPERGRGQGPSWAWFDEAAMMVERAWDIFSPSLTEHRGNCFFTMSPMGFDWCYERLWLPASKAIPGFWATQCETIDNPWIAEHCAEEIATAKATMDPDLFDQEYRGRFVNFTGSIYAGDVIDGQVLE